MIKESKRRILVKSVIWRIFAGFLTFVITLAAAQTITVASLLAVTVATFDQGLKFLTYTLYEYVWTKLSYGKSLSKADGCTIWLTGLSGSGKTTIAKKLVEKLENKLLLVDYLDGDIVRASFCADLGFTKQDRDENIRRVGYVASHVSKYAIVICAFISPYRKTRMKVKEKTNNFVEVFVKCPLAVCEERDVKGLYAKARAGEIKNFTGIDDPYEEPESADVVVCTDKETVDESADRIIDYLKKQGLILRNS